MNLNLNSHMLLAATNSSWSLKRAKFFPCLWALVYIVPSASNVISLFSSSFTTQLLEESFLGWVRCRCYFPQLLRFLRPQHPLCVVLPIDLSISSSSLGMAVGECPPRVCIVSFGNFCTPHTCGFCTFPMLCSCLRPDCGSPTPQLSRIHWWPSYIVLGNKKGWRSSSGQKCVWGGGGSLG